MRHVLTVCPYCGTGCDLYLKDNAVDVKPAARQAQRKADIIIDVSK
ncbi:MAG: hypothetical protein ISS44_04895 [Candidatus Omnitrophica bacterium]|nr:hypothetical protein [Candidatus Aminicenantes bacterium]MBL7081880.1 hypothetical protein [Candidatus Omnitrophota bacterium]